MRGIPTFPQLRRLREINLNRTYHLLQKPDILICYQQNQNEELALRTVSCRNIAITRKMPGTGVLSSIKRDVKEKR